ncbi:MAG: NADH-quinone oxidoreductase subunit [Solirubrobacterales bacterium]|jgi:NADH-quinone oxidoreductase subunit G|nr:NADH-quinone oxidoreductase subunit [Solirubrobacterales bacterium]
MSNGKEITLVVDGVEVPAADGAMLVDAAKGGDVEIPVFCYEPKLGGPVGACRMCLVEVEGIPKLQTACSTPVRDGMVVYTQTERVQEAQNAVVEFLLVNHPLDCPVCDKGGECPLQDISMGWGHGKSRVTDPKRHFRKPVPLSPLVRIDRERCILCYRCVRFSQEVAEDEQLQLLERGSRSFVGTFDDRPYIAPFHGNIIELCPVGALTSEAYRFRARPWDIEDAGSVCTLCPSQCNVKFTVRDEKVARVLGRDNHEVDDGWLCDKGRFGFQMFHSEDRLLQPMVRTGGALHKATWDEALQKAADGLKAAGPRTAILIGSQASNEEGYLLQRIARQALGSPHVDSRAGHRLARETALALGRPELSASMADIDGAKTVLVLGTDPLHSMPILDLRLRKAMRNHGTRVAVVSERPTALDGGADETLRYAPGDAATVLSNIAADLASSAGGSGGADAERIAGALDPGNTVVIHGERIGYGPDGDRALGALLAIADALNLSASGCGLIEIPETSNARGLREVGCLPTAGPGLSEAAQGMSATEIRDALEADELDALILWDVDPIRELPDPERWRTALGAADFVLEVGMFGNASGGQADVFLPGESHAEKEGTVTHPDGRVQRVRPSVPHPGDTRHGWQWLAELAFRLGHETGVDSSTEALEALVAEVPFYAGLTHEEIGGTGVRWQNREQASSFPTPRSALGEGASGSPAEHQTTSPGTPAETDHAPREEREAGGPEAPSPETTSHSLRLGTYRDLWAHEVTERSPALRFLMPGQTLELSLADAEHFGVAQGDQVNVRSNGHSVMAKVAIRERIRPGSGFLIDGLAEQSPNVLAGAETVQVEKAGE